MITTKYGMIDKQEYNSYLDGLKNRVYKVLPLKEEDKEWRKYLSGVMNEIHGLRSLKGGDTIVLLANLEFLNEVCDNHKTFRKTIFECLSTIEKMKEGESHRVTRAT